MSQLIENYTYPILEWTFGGAAILVTLGRFYVRFRHLSALGWRWDDTFNVLALLSLVVFLAMLEELQYTSDPYAGPRFELAGDMLLWTTLYLVKAYFLSLCWYIFRISAPFRRAWWAVVGFTFLTFWPIFLSELWQCGSPAQYDDVQACTDSNDSQSVWWRIDPLAFRFALHIASDAAILALPLFFIRSIQTSRARKVSIAAIFALSIVDIICGILRNSAALCASLNLDTAEKCSDIGLVMDVCEPSIAVIVCALPAYRVLLPSSPAASRRKHQNAMEKRSAQTPTTMGTATTERSAQTSGGPRASGSVSMREWEREPEPEPAFMV